MKLHYLILIIMISALTGCRSAKSTSADAQPAEVVQTSGAQSALMPKAVAYRTNGDYASRVMINLNPDGDILSYPAPGDVSAASAPVDLGDGWWLDRRGGVSLNSVFLTYTYPQYAALPATPSLQELRESIIPGAHVTEILKLPCNAGQAQREIDNIKQYIKSHQQNAGVKTIISSKN